MIMQLILVHLIYLASVEKTGLAPPSCSLSARIYHLFYERRKKLQTSVVYRRKKRICMKQGSIWWKTDIRRRIRSILRLWNGQNNQVSFVEGRRYLAKVIWIIIGILKMKWIPSMNQDVKGQDLYVVWSPVSGNGRSIFFVFMRVDQAGQVVGNYHQILIHSCTLRSIIPRNIGYLSIGMPVNVHR